jgi:Flavin-binding monooxygenase-like
LVNNRFVYQVYLSLKQNSTTLPINSSTLILKPRLSHFTRDSPVFVDNTSIVDADTLILATGYEFRIPFLDVGGVLRTDPSAKSSNSTHGYTGLTTNLRYIEREQNTRFKQMCLLHLFPHQLPNGHLEFLYLQNLPTKLVQLNPYLPHHPLRLLQ